MLDKIMENLIDYGVKINMEKGEFLRKEIHYFGFVVSEAVPSQDPERVAAFKNVKVPKNVRKLQSFMHLVSYYSPFIAALHNLKPPFNKLLCKDAKFDCPTDYQEALDGIKAKIFESTVLSYFGADKEIIVQADASEYGLGGVLL
ncbi:unnamed protein product [Schistocephalus solidus]|uniref:RT_RNaseH_2 domain-containing protein n=1 Tax=Schistocephalus solidus TaxID=70667 RepID=A0A183SQ44_SCHSO|nr:unnamed protein product [Schistocephalus solidus]